jgi:acyl-CoA synthetase (AMP-forming)/AMP-acid ligase II
MNLFDGLRHQAKINPDRPAICCKESKYSYAEFHERVVKLGNALMDLGVKKGDRVAALLLNCHRYLELYYATALIGAIIVPLNYRLAPKELVYILNDSECETLFVDEGLWECIKPVCAELDTLKRTCFTGSASDVPSGLESYEKLINDSSAKLPDVEIQDSDLAGIFYTGGTTGLAKGLC